MAGTPLDQLEQAQAVMGDLLAGVGEQQWQAATPCSDWTLRELVGHLVGGEQLFARMLRGEPVPDGQHEASADRLGDDPAGAYRDAAAGSLAAFRTPGVLERVVTVPIGQVPGMAALHLRLVETLVHGWDVARATGRPAAFPDDVAEQELAATRRLLSQVPPDRSPFGPPQPAPDDVPALDRLAALLGRPLAAA